MKYIPAGFRLMVIVLFLAYFHSKSQYANIYNIIRPIIIVTERAVRQAHQPRDSVTSENAVHLKH